MRKATLIGPRVINAVAWRRLIPGLRRGLYDCVICGIEITSDKADEASLMHPLLLYVRTIAAESGRSPFLTSFATGALALWTQPAALRMLEDTLGITATTYDAELNALSGRGKRRLSGVLLDLSDRQKSKRRPARHYSSANRPFGRIGYGIAVKKGSGATQREIDDAPRELIACAHFAAFFRVGDSGPIGSHKVSASLQHLLHRIPRVRLSPNLSKTSPLVSSSN